MKKCLHCGTDLADNMARYCPSCGEKLHDSPATDQTESDLEFVVSEAPATDPAFVGQETNSKPDELGIETNANLMEHEAEVVAQGKIGDVVDSDLSVPIGDSAPPAPPPTFSAPLAQRQVSGATPIPNTESESTVSESKKGDYLSADEKEQLIRKLSLARQQAPTVAVAAATTVVAATNPPMETEASASLPVTDDSLASPQISQRGKGIAFFYRNYVQIVGSQTLHAGDDLMLGNRAYELKPKRINPKLLIGSAAIAMVLILIIIVSQFVAVDTGQGRIFGMVLDEAGQPYVMGATVRLTELGQSIKSNPQGFFLFEGISAGTHQIECLVNGQLIGTDYATVVNRESSMLVLQPTTEFSQASLPSSPLVPASEAAVVSTSDSDNRPAGAAPATDDRQQTASTAKSNKYAKLKLQTNVESARLLLDGAVVGAGNMVYPKLAPGDHEYTVDAAGYRPVSGNIRLVADQTETMILTLEPSAPAVAVAVPTADSYVAQGKDFVQQGRFDEALTIFSDAIAKQASNPKAYLERAAVYRQLNQRPAAHNDYLAAADLYATEGDANQAVVSYNNAIEMNQKSIEARLGRASVFMAQGQQIAALADYEAAKEINGRSAEAHFGLGRARFEQGNFKKAVKHFDDARELEPSNPAVYQYLMLSYAALEDEKKVMKAFDKFREFASDDQIRMVLTSAEYGAVAEIVKGN